MAQGHLHWHEIFTNDQAATKKFYSELFGWQYETVPMPEGEYTMIKLGERPIAGVMDLATAGEGVPPNWHTYIEVDDIAATENAVTTNGGTVLMPAMTVAGVGSFLTTMDNQGAAISYIQPEDTYTRTPPVHNEICWIEHHSDDPQKAVDFYTAVVNYATESMDMPNGKYHMLGLPSEAADGKSVSGLMQKQMEQAPTMWLLYVNVEDCDSTVAKIQAMGGTILAPAFSAPGVGRMSIALDNAGAAFAVIQFEES